MRVMLKRLALVTGAAAEVAGSRNTGAVARETGAGARETGTTAARETGAVDREIAGAVAQEAAAEGGTMRLNPNVKLEDIIICIDCYWLLLLCFNITIKNNLRFKLLIFRTDPLNP
jgi:hypothetical protein